MNSWSNITTLVRYWMKGRFTKVTAIWMVMGEVFSVALVLFVGSTFLSFSSRFGLGNGLSYLGLTLLFGLFLVGLVQSGFNGSGLPMSAADVDYVLTSPVNPREVFAAKLLMNSFTTVLLSFPPILTLYLRFAQTYGTGLAPAFFAGFVTLAFFVLCLLFSADITLSLNSRAGERVGPLRNAVLAFVAAVSLAPVALLIPGAPPELAQIAAILPSGLAAGISYTLVSGAAIGLGTLLELALLTLWFFVLLGVGTRLSQRNFYEVLQISDRDSEGGVKDARLGRGLQTDGRPVWSVVRSKERVLMSRTKENRSLFVNALFLAGFMVVYSLSGVFLSSPTSFLFLLFIIGSFGSGNATRWLEKERLWLIKTSAVDLRRYVREVYRARVTPLLLVLSPVAAGVGAPLLIEKVNGPAFLLSIGLSLPGALEVAALMMAGGMFFAARYGQSSVDETLTTQGQDMADVRRFLYQTLINLGLVAPLMMLVLSAGYVLAFVGVSGLLLTTLGLGVAAFVYSAVALHLVLGSAGASLQKREDL
ncbi:MAG: hypothetical protein JRN09_02200 [Nitrososphaerota archaeon]|nr:hypothetical protein [Nitrososphaerota archaeon]